MPKELIELEIDEVSLVDVPANEDAKVLLFKRDEEKSKVLKSSDVRKMQVDAKQNLEKARHGLDDAFEDHVRKNQRPGESFAQSYAREIDTPFGRRFYAEHTDYARQAQMVDRLANDAHVHGSMIDDGGAGTETAKLEKSFDEYVEKRMQPDETFEGAYDRLLNSRKGREFYAKHLAARGA